MKHLFGNLFVRLIVGLWMSLKVTQCQTSHTRIPRPNMPRCINTLPGKTCFTTILANNGHPELKPFEEASDLCKVHVPGSSLIAIKSLEMQRVVEGFISRQVLQNEAIITDERKLSANESQAWSWVNGHPYFPDVSQDASNKPEQFHDGACVESKHGKSMAYCFSSGTSRFGYICENSAFSQRQDNKLYIANEDLLNWYDARKKCLRYGGDLASLKDLQATEELLSLKENQKYWIGLHRNKWIWNSTGAAITYTNWKGGFPDESSDKQCICIKPQCTEENGRRVCEAATHRKWLTCNCNNNYAIVCQKEENSDALPTKIVFTEEMDLSTSIDFKSSASVPVDTSTEFHISLPSSTSLSAIAPSSQSVDSEPSTTRTNPAIDTTPAIATTTSTITPSTTNSSTTATSTKTPTATIPTTTTTSTKTRIATNTTTSSTSISTTPLKPVISSVTAFTSTLADNSTQEIDRKTVSTPYLTQQRSSYFSVNQTNRFVSSSTSPSTGLSSTQQILLILLLLVAVVFILAAVILVIRKRRYDRRNEGLPKTNTKQSETVSSVYAAVVPVNRPSEVTVPPGNTIYTDVEMIKQPTPPTSDTIYASVQPTSETVDMGKSVVYADLDLQKKDQQRPKSADKTTACLSPIYSQPFESPTSDSNTDYVEPYKPDKNPPTTAPGLNHNAAADQQNIYSLAKAIPLGDPNVIYSEPNKPTKSSTSEAKAVKAADPIYLEAIEVKPGAESEGVATQDPSAVYAEPIKLKKSP